MQQRSFPAGAARRAAAAILAAALGLGGQAALAANQSDWWVYIANDKAQDVRTLLRRGADPNVRHRNGQPAIMRAVVDDAWNVFDVLAADKRTDVNVVNPANETPLMYLAVAGQTERARALIKRGAQVNRLGWTPLHYAASKGQVQVARLLLQHKAMVNAPSPDGATPLMMAAYAGSAETVQLLLDAGADIATRDLKGMNAADWAEQGKASRLARELRELIARAEERREAMRAPGGAKAPAAAAAPRSEPARTPAPPAAAPSQDGEAPMLKGVSGIRLNTYD